MVEEEKTDYIGKYVDYIPEIGTFDDHVGSAYSGWNGSPANTEISTDTNLKWRILFIENNKLTLISDVTTAVSAFGLGGAEGYNNGVLLLNNACKEMYSNSNWAAGRSLNRADIESVSSYDPYTYATQYGVLQTDSDFRRYPLMFAKEINGQVDGVSGSKYNAHEQNEYIKGTYSRATNSIAVTQTYYNHEMLEEDFVNSNPTYLELFRYMPGSKNNINSYWLASREIEFRGLPMRFGINLVTNGKIAALHTFFNHEYGPGATSTTNQNKLGIRPVVKIDLTKVNVGLTGTGAENDGYSLTLK